MFSTPTASPGRPNTRLVEERRQRRALAAGGDVAAAEVGHHVDAGQFRQQRRLAPAGGVAGAVELAAAGAARSGRGRRWPRTSRRGQLARAPAAAARPRHRRASARCRPARRGAVRRRRRLLSASSSARSARAKGALACAQHRGRPAAKSASTPSTPSSEVPDIRPMKRSGMRRCSRPRRQRLSAALATWSAPRPRPAACAWHAASCVEGRPRPRRTASAPWLLARRPRSGPGARR